MYGYVLTLQVAYIKQYFMCQMCKKKPQNPNAIAVNVLNADVFGHVERWRRMWVSRSVAVETGVRHLSEGSQCVNNLTGWENPKTCEGLGGHQGM